MAYLTVDEQSTYISVFADGCEWRVAKNVNSELIRVFTNSIERTSLFYDIRSSAATYRLQYDENRVETIKIATGRHWL